MPSSQNGSTPVLEAGFNPSTTLTVGGPVMGAPSRAVIRGALASASGSNRRDRGRQAVLRDLRDPHHHSPASETRLLVTVRMYISANWGGRNGGSAVAR